MKIFFTLFALVAVALAVYPFLEQPDNADSVTGLPWQIEIQADASTRVFGLHIGVSRLSDAIASLGDDMELAIVAASGEAGDLEMYYGHYRAGLLSGKLVLQARVNEQVLKGWRENALRSEYMATGQAKKYTLSPDDLPQILNEIIVGITFIPSVNLDEEVILARFGKPERRLQTDDAVHFLYPAKGLDLALHEGSKEVLQYVSPDVFQQLIQPLLPNQ